MPGRASIGSSLNTASPEEYSRIEANLNSPLTIRKLFFALLPYDKYPRPDLNGRVGVLKVHTQKIKLAPHIDLEAIARGTPGLSGAELANLVNEAALLAGRMGKTQVENDDFDRAKAKILMGLERKTMIISDEEKKNTADHEAGHTMVAKLIPGTDPVHKVSIIPRGMALGVTLQLPTADRYSYDRDHLLNNIAILLGGRAAEEIALNHMTTGAGNDLDRATMLARKMVPEWGMSDKLGPLTYGKKEEQIFLGREIAQHRDYSEHTAVEIDNEVKRIVMDNYHRARTLIQDRADALHGLAKGLLEKETLDAADIDAIVNGQPAVA